MRSTSSLPISPEFGLTYEDYLETHQSTKRIISFYLWHILLLFLAIVLHLFGIIQAHNEKNQISPYTLLRFISLLPITFHLYHLLQQNYYPHTLKPQPFRLSAICNTYLLTLTLASSIALIGSSLTPTCTLPLCEDVPAGKIQPTLLFQNVLFAIVSPIIVKSHSRWCPWLTYAISFIASIVSAILVQKSTTSTFFAIIAIYLLGAIILYDNEMTLRDLYHHHMTQEEQLLIKLKSQNDQEILLIKEQQLRLLFGNIAHDLKSPLQAFTMELGLLQDTLTSSSSSVAIIRPPSSSARATGPSSSIRSSLSTKEECGESRMQFQARKSIEMLQSICSFMLMTINRAVDYSKVSSGIRLVPSLKVTNLSKTLSWVLRTVGTAAASSAADQEKQQIQESQSANDGDVPINIEPFPPNLSLNILTDPQWLRENLLCLVSNAQKFTSAGNITVRCFLEAKESYEPDPTSLFCHGISQRSYQKIRNSAALHPLRSSLTLAASESGPVGGVGSSPTAAGGSVHVAGRHFRIPLTTPSPSNPLISTQFLRFEVEDTGIGIEPNERAEIFQPFKRSGNDHSHSGGTGLGLHSVLKRMESLGGHCGVTSRRDHQKGSCFWFTLPYLPDHNSSTWPSLSPRTDPSLLMHGAGTSGSGLNGAVAAPVNGEAFVLEDIREMNHSSNPPSEISSPHTHSRHSITSSHRPSLHSLSSLPPLSEASLDTPPVKILLVEDSILIQKTTARALAKEGYEVEVARHGKECLEMTLRKRYDCLLMDINMPVMDGIEATRNLRERERNDLTYSALVAPVSTTAVAPAPWVCASLSPISVHLQPRFETSDPFSHPLPVTTPPPPPLCIIGFSANGDSNTIKEALEVGMNDFLLKPLSMKDFQECFQRLRSPPSPLSCSLP